MRKFREGEQALRDRDLVKARERFKQAYQLRDQLDPMTAQRLQDHLQLLTTSQPITRPAAPPKNLIDDAAAHAQMAAKQLSAEVARQQVAARNVQESDPKKAGEILAAARTSVENSEIDSTARAQLIKRLDVSQMELDKYIAGHRAQIDLDAQNKDVRSRVERERLTKLEIDDQLAKLTDDYNKLMDERRFSEAEVVVKRCTELAPDNPVVVQLKCHVQFARRNYQNQQLIDEKEQAAFDTFFSVEESAKPWDDRNPHSFGDVKNWKDLTNRRLARLNGERTSRRSERELDIERKLKTPVSLNFHNKPLSEVLDDLAKLAAVNLHLDPQGLQEEGVDSSTAGDDRLAPGNLAEERAESDPRTSAPELRDQGRGAQDHQRATARQ